MIYDQNFIREVMNWIHKVHIPEDLYKDEEGVEQKFDRAVLIYDNYCMDLGLLKFLKGLIHETKRTYDFPTVYHLYRWGLKNKVDMGDWKY